MQCQDIRNKKPLEIRLDKVNRTITPFDYPPFDFRFASIMLKHNNTMQSHMRLPLDVRLILIFFLINETKKQILVYDSVGIVRPKVLF